MTAMTVHQRSYVHSAYAERLARLLFGHKTLADVASAREELSADLPFHHPKPLYESADLRRISGLGAGTTREYEQEQTQAVHRIHRGSVAYTVKNVLHLDGNLYAPGFKHGIGLHKGSLFSRGTATEVSSGVLGQSWLGSRYFGHWLLDDIPLARLAAQRGQPLGTARMLEAQQRQYLALFDTPVRHLPRAAFVRTLEIMQDWGFNALRIQRWRDMRREFKGALNPQKHAGVFLMRGGTGEQRLLSNETAVAELLSRKGFRVVNPGLSDLATVRAATANAKIVIGVEGSQLSHGLMGVADGGAMLVLQPPFRFNNAYRERCDLLGIAYAFMVGHADADGFTIDLDALRRMLDKLALRCA